MAQKIAHAPEASVPSVAVSDSCLTGEELPDVPIGDHNMQIPTDLPTSQSVRLTTGDGNLLYFSSLAATAKHLLASGMLDLRLI